MDAHTLERITGWIRGLALPLVVLAFATYGTSAMLGALVGASLAIANWFVIHYVARSMVGQAAQPSRRSRIAALLLVKTLGLLTLAMICVRFFDARGLILGVSTLVLGIFMGALHAHFDKSAARAPLSVTGRED